MVSPRQRQAHALMSAEGLGERLMAEGDPHKLYEHLDGNDPNADGMRKTQAGAAITRQHGRGELSANAAMGRCTLKLATVRTPGASFGTTARSRLGEQKRGALDKESRHGLQRTVAGPYVREEGESAALFRLDDYDLYTGLAVR